MNVAAALLGARPRANAQGTLFADGRLLVRTLSVSGPGLDIAASGERGLLGGLGFRGQARVGNLAFSHAGAQGAIAANWQAFQSAAGRPWNFAFDARATRFAAGFAEVDRLLGAAPRLSAQGQAQDGKIVLTQARLQGAAAVLGASGKVGLDGNVALKLAWNARGPFEIGPLDVAGDAIGTGDVSGTLAVPKADLAADFASIAAPGLTLTKAHVAATVGGVASQGGGQITVAADSDFRSGQGGL